MNLEHFDPSLDPARADLHTQSELHDFTHQLDSQAIGFESHVAEPFQMELHQPSSWHNAIDSHQLESYHPFDAHSSQMHETFESVYGDSHTIERSHTWADAHQSSDLYAQPESYHLADAHTPFAQSDLIFPRSASDSASELLEKANAHEKLAEDHLKGSEEASKTADYFRDRDDAANAERADRTAQEKMAVSEQNRREAEELREQAHKL
jgi:hypothetical protein